MARKFAEAFAQAAHLDGIVFKFDTADENMRQNISAKLHMMFHKYVQLDEREHKRCYQVNIYRMDNRNMRGIMKIGIYGAYLRYVKSLHASLIAHVDEAHFKAYIYNENEARFKQFTLDSVMAVGGRQPTVFGEQANPNSRKGKGYGMRIGDRNSDYNFIYYTRPGQRTGLELRIMDKACHKRAATVLENAVTYDASNQEAWETLYNTLAQAAGDEYVRDTKARGVSVDWFFGITDVKEAGLDGPVYDYYFETVGASSAKTWVPTRLNLDDDADIDPGLTD